MTVARTLVALALLPAMLLAGCSGSSTEVGGDADEGLADGAGGSSSVTTTAELGSAKGTALGPTEMPFDVVTDVPATNVRWEITVEGVGSNLLARVTGPVAAPPAAWPRLAAARRLAALATTWRRAPRPSASSSRAARPRSMPASWAP